MTCRRSSGGMTVVEVLCVIAIGALLLGLAMAAVGAARNASLRAECQSRMRQIGLAMQSHHETHACFANIEPNQPCHGQKKTSAFIQFLPFLDERSLYDSFPSCGTAGVNNGFLKKNHGAPLSLRCPSQEDRRGISYRLSTGSTVNGGMFDMRLAGLKASDGVFPILGRRTSADIADGLSQTVGLSEKVSPSGSNLAGDPANFFWEPVSSIWMLGDMGNISEDSLSSICGNAPETPLHYVSDGGHLWYGNDLEHTRYNHAVLPNADLVDCWTYGPQFAILRASSWHSGGVNTLRMDGSVHFVANNSDRSLWRAMASISGAD